MFRDNHRRQRRSLSEIRRVVFPGEVAKKRIQLAGTIFFSKVCQFWAHVAQ
jgi:hypothetical protein